MAGIAQTAQPAPSPTQQTIPAPQDAPADPKAASPLPHQSFEKRKWSAYVDPRERVPKLDTHDKMNFWLHEEFEPFAPAPAFISAGFGQLIDEDPKYGTDSGGFGERLGAAFLRQASMRFFCDSVMPTLAREDPRYYRVASGSYGSRALHAAVFTFVDRNDNEQRTLNKSDLLGHLAASVLTLAYYPSTSRSTSVVLRTWATSIAGNSVNNMFLEFWPDVLNWKRHRGH